MTWRIISHFQPPAEKARVSLFFVCNNKHLYPITDKALRNSIRIKKQITLDDMKVNYKEFEDVGVCTAGEVAGCEKSHVIVTDCSDLTKIAASLMKSTGAAVEQYSFFEHKLTMFKHPTKHQIVVDGKDYHRRKAVADKLLKKFKGQADFKFVNQSFGKLAITAFYNMFGVFPKSGYSTDYQWILKNNPAVAWRSCENWKVNDYTSVDISKCFLSCLMNNKFPFPVFSSFDAIAPCVLNSVDEIRCGEYYCRRDFYMAGGTIKKSKGFYSWGFIHYILSQKYIDLYDITYCILARGSIPAATFKEFIRGMMRLFPHDFKEMINQMIGILGCYKTKKIRAGVSTDEETVMATINEYDDHRISGMYSKLTQIGEYYFLRVVDETIQECGNVPIHRSVISQSWIALDKMYHALKLKPEQVVGYNTDAVKFVGQFNSAACKAKADCAPGDYHVEAVKDSAGFVKSLFGHPMETIPMYDGYTYTPLVKSESTDTPIVGSCVVLGLGGCGKSHELVAHYNRLIADRRRVVVLCNAHKACENLKARGVPAQTFRSFLFNKETGGLSDAKFAEVDTILID